ncbi:Urb2/Npa2 family-domain-containing protein [Bombardia bombarda]|uniref:Urb2/Npa2 family-domain-containing protein n=1 Tax=Bombardia bombarda TaxID=252184 RepID=A0AA39XBA2_9PEZI|nr:Urb2/Npa2 family-domain-containing protein [Bombardia bombarda]
MNAYGIKVDEAALVRAVRALDQGGIETTPDKLERVWSTLSHQEGGGVGGGGAGNFHAAEEMLLRWLLKNMAGSTDAAERVRRYAPAWNIMGAVFARIPLFSLAKSLADRRFVNTLQQTLKDLSNPQTQQGATGSDVEMADAPTPLEEKTTTPAQSRKRKRSAPATFELAVQRQTTGCLQAADAVLESLRILLSRCEMKSADGGLPSSRMGAEHIKSLFSASAAEVMETLVPFITLCTMAADSTEAEPLTEKSSWMSTFSALWDLHLQSGNDASEVAIHLSGLGMNLLGKLTGIPRQRSLGIDAAVQGRWGRDLRRFLARNMVLPSRAAFLNKRSQEVIQIAVDMSSATVTTSLPVLFDLASKSPQISGDKTPKKDYEAWIQTIFDVILLALKSFSPTQSLTAIEAIMEMAAARGTALTATSLRTVCKEYALRPKKFDWTLLLSIIKLNPDVFLISEEGQELLELVLKKTQKSESMDDRDFDRALQFIVLLAEGYAKARDIAAFFKTWLRYLAVSEPQVDLERIWAQKELLSAVAGLLHSSLNTNQLLEIMDWLSEQNSPAESLARIHILGAISSGISQEEFVDAANMRTFEGAFLQKFSKKEPSTVSVSRWTIAENSLTRGTLEQAGHVWSQVKPDISRVLKKSAPFQEATFAAFKCCVAAWVANHPRGPDEDEAAALACLFIDRLEKEADSDEDVKGAVTKGTYVSWILSSSHRLVSLLAERTGVFPNIIRSLMVLGGDKDAVIFDSALAVSSLVLDNDNNTYKPKITSGLIDQMIALTDTASAGASPLSTKVAIQFLLDTPAEVLDRQQREACMERLVSQLARDQDSLHSAAPGYWTPVLGLMIKLMERPTFYNDMSFAHLETIGRCIFKTHRQSKEGKSVDGVTKARNEFRLLGWLATLTIRQMASSSLEEREKAYLADAVTVLKSPCQDSDMVPRLVLLRAFIDVVQDSPALKRLKEAGLDLEEVKTHQLLQGASPFIAAKKLRGRALLPLLVALDAVDLLDHKTIKKAFATAVPSLLDASDWLIRNGSENGWEVRMFLAKYFVEELGFPLRIKLPVEGAANSDDESEQVISAPTPGSSVDKTTMMRYIDVVIGGVDEDTKLGYLKELLLQEKDEGSSDALGRLFVVQRLVEHLRGSRPSAPPTDGDTAVPTTQFDLAQAHSMLCGGLLQTMSATEFILAARTLYLLLDQKAACMTQWNIDLTMSSVSAVCSAPAVQPLLAASPKTYDWLCRLVEIVIKRHRKRLDGHFHVLITVLQSLLRRLLLSHRSSDAWGGSGAIAAGHGQERHAKLFSRLVTLVCEPSVASVSRGHHGGAAGTTGGGSLDSEKDRAKRYAGHHMYLVLMQYVKLQLECVVPHGAREVLETGMYSILDITTTDGLRIMNDAMDPSGRVIFKELYKRYQKFGKWSGI